MNDILRISKYVFQALTVLLKLLRQLEQLNQSQEQTNHLLQRILDGKDPDEVLNIEQAAQLLGVTSRTIRNRKKKGKINSLPGSEFHFLKSELLKSK